MVTSHDTSTSIRSRCSVIAAFLIGLTTCSIMDTPLAALSADAGVQSGGEDEMRWEEAEAEVGKVRFSQHFWDSLRTLHAIAPGGQLRSGARLPFSTREKLVFDGGWGFIRAGFAILEAHPDPHDSCRMLLGGKAVSNNFVSTFYKVRDYVLSQVDREGLYPFAFEQQVLEGRYRAQRWTLYDQVNQQVFDHRRADPYPVAPFTHDFISSIYYLRTLTFGVGDTFSIPCFVHARDYPILFRVKGRDRIKVNAGTFTCLVVEPRLVGEGRGFTKRDQMELWLTDDKYRMPVLIKAKAGIGSLSARLLYYERE